MSFVILLQASVPQGPADSKTPEVHAEAVARLFAERCYSCHNDVDKEGDLSMRTHEALMRGGKNGSALVPGNADESRMVQMVEGFLEPTMPEDDFLFDEDIQIIKDWIQAGAPPWRGDLARLKIKDVPDIQPKVPVEGEIASIAFGPDGQLVAAGTYQEVRLIDVDSRAIQDRLEGHIETVRAVIFSPDGALLAAGGGMPSRYGEVKVWNTAGRELLHTLEGHSDSVYAIDFSPDSKLLATSSYDHVIKIWNVNSGKEFRTINAHIDAVYSVAFDPVGERLFSASADRTVKIWDVETGEQIFKPLSESTGELYALALHPHGDLVAAAGEDKMIRMWRIAKEGGRLVRSTFAHNSPILRLAFTPDGKTLISAGSDQLVKFWSVETLQETHVLEKQPDWVLSMDVSPNGQLLAMGRYDGTIDFHTIGSE